MHKKVGPPRRRGRLFARLLASLSILLGLALFTALPAEAEHNIQVTTDVDGPDDVPAQTDVTQLGFDDSHLPDYYVAQMQFDDTAYPGGNTGDGCIFFDSDDAEGFSDFAVCGSFIQNTDTGQVELQSAALYDCKGSEPNNDEGKRCGFTGGGGDGSNGIIAQDLDGDGIFESDGDGNLLATPYDTTCSLTTTGVDPFNGVGDHNAGGEQDPINDTQLTCLIYADELVELDGDVPSGIVVSNACSFTSPDPGSESKDCVVDAGSGFLIIVKNATGGDATFDYTVDGAAFASITTVGGSGSTNPIAIDGRGGLALAEVVPAGWQLDSATCNNGDDPGSLTIPGAATVTCTFNNSIAGVAPDISLVKTADPTELPEPGGDVTFTVAITNNGDAGTIDSLVDDVHGDLATSCVDGGGVALVGQTIGAGETLTCTFTANVSGNPGFSETDTVTTVVSNDTGSDTASDTATVTIVDVPAAIEVVKTADPTSVDEPGDDVTFSFTINNLSGTDSVDITSLNDSIYGDLNGKGDCSVPQTIAAGGSYNCSFTEFVSATETNVVTASGVDDDGNPVSDDDDATVTLNDLPSSIEVVKTANPTSVDEPGADVTFSFVVNNTSAADSVDITSLNDTIYGDLNGKGDCSVPQTIAAGGSYNCSFTEFVSATETNVVTASGADDDGNPVSDDDDATVTVNDVPSSIEVTKTANPTSVPESGGSVTYTFVVENTSAADSVTIDSLNDSIYGDLNGQGDCVTGATLAPGESYTCEITETVVGNAGETINNVLTVEGTDDDGNAVGGTDDADVTVTDLPSEIQVLKTATPIVVDEPGGTVTFSFVVNNLSAADSVDITSLVDSVYGDLNGQGTCSTPQTIAAGDNYVCSFDAFVAGDPGDVETNVVTASGTDDDGNPVSDDDDANVTINDVPSSILVSKTASPTSVPETGGDVAFTVTVENTSAVDDVTINAVTDDVFGDVSASCTPALPATLSPGESLSCTFTEFVSGDAGGSGHVNVATAAGEDDDGNPVEDDDDETVTFDDVLPDVSITKTANPTSVDEPGGDVEFTIVVTNNSAEDATIDSLTDSDFDLTGNCADAVGTVLAGGASYNCVFTEFVAGNFGDDHNNVATVVASDDEGNTDTETDDADVVINDVPSSILVTKTSNVTSVPETGGDVTFTITVENTSAVDDVTIESVVDTVFGDVSASCTPALPATLSPDESLTCSFTEFISGQAGESHVNVATGSGTDDDGNPVEDDDDEEIPFDDVLPDVSITKTADPTSVPETGGDVAFTIVVTNNSLEDATIDSLTDSDFDLSPECDGAVGTVLASGDSYSCTFTETLSGDFGGPDHENTATVVASDDDGNTDEASDDATVTYTDVLPDISITKTANPTSVDEPGGDVEFTIVVTNDSLEAATIDSLTDTDFDLSPECDDAVGTVLASGDSYSCTFTRFVAGNPADGDHENTATAVASDDDGNSDTASDDETVVINDALPAITVTKTADQAEVFAPGEDVTFTIVITNDSVGSDPVTIDSITDDVFGDIGVECGAPLTIAPGDSANCEITRTISGDHTNTVTASGADDEGNPVDGSDDASVEFANPSLTVDKLTNGADGANILEGETVTWTYTVTNDGDVPLTGIAVTDDQGVVVDCPATSLAPGESTTCTGSGTATVGDYANIGTAGGSYTDADGDTANASDTDPSSYFGADPSVTITKTFADDSVIAGGAGSSFDLVVTNDGNVPLTDVSVTDTVDGRLTITGITGTDGADDGSTGQDVAWLIPSLGVGESATITVSFTVAADVPEANGAGGLNDDPSVPNDASASSTYTDDSGNSETVADSDDDTVDILVDIDLAIVKTFDPTAVPQGTNQSFTLAVTNSGPSDAVDVSVTDLVDDSLAVQNVTVTSGTGDCGASSGQSVDCTLQIPAGETAIVTVDYQTAPFQGDDGSTRGGDTFRFVFANGDVLEGSTATGEVFLNGADVSGDVTIVQGLSRNDVVFDPDGPGGEPAIELHLSCSDPFTGGWGQSGGPVEGVNSTDYQVAFFSIARYNNNGFVKSCGNVTNPFDVDNTGNTSGDDSFGTETDSDSATVTIEPGITIDRLQTNGKRLTVRLTNYTGVDKEILDVQAIWPNSNGDLRKVSVEGAAVWQGTDDAPDALLDGTVAGWVGGTLNPGEEILRLDFQNKSANSGYTVRVTFTDGTFLDISA